MHGSMVSGVQLKVSLARRQPVIQPINDAASAATWSTIGMCRIETYAFVACIHVQDFWVLYHIKLENIL
jgi:hypothetical protein